MMEGLSASEHPLDKEESSLKKKKIRKLNTKQSTAESPVKNKKTTSKDKSTTCKKPSRGTKPSKTLAQESISKEKAFSPFWTPVCKAMSKKLWSPAEIDSVDLLSNSFNGSSNDKEPNLPSWSRVTKVQNPNCPTMSFPSFKFSAVGEMAKDGTVTRSIKVKLRMTKKAKTMIKKWEAGYRFTYNKALDFLKLNPKTSKMNLRTLMVTKKQNKRSIEKTSLFGKDNINPFIDKNPWLCKIPKDIRQQASFEASKNFKASRTYKARKKNATCSYKVRDTNKGWVIGIEKEHVAILPNTKVRFYSGSTKVVVRTVGELPKWLMPSEFEDEVEPPKQILLQNRGKSYYLIFPYEVKVYAKESETYDGHIVGLDPGVRKFMTSYGTDGRIGFFGSKNPVKKLCRMEWYKTLLRSKIQAKRDSVLRSTGKDRRTLKNKFKRIQVRVENIRKDFHHKVANWLTNNYQCVVIGKLPKGIISKDRSLPKSVKRAYNSLGHYKFRSCLKDKCQTRGVVYQEINESYTSKTCTCCGILNDVGSSETYKCGCQETSWDRDVNGARNILLKAISESYFRIVLEKNKTLSLKQPVWTQHPPGYSLGISILRNPED